MILNLIYWFLLNNFLGAYKFRFVFENINLAAFNYG